MAENWLKTTKGPVILTEGENDRTTLLYLYVKALRR